MNEERTEGQEQEKEEGETVETLTEKIKELEGIIATHEENTKTLNDRIAELEGNLEAKNKEYKALTDERDKLKRDFDTFKQNTATGKNDETGTEESEELDMGELLLAIKNIMN